VTGTTGTVTGTTGTVTGTTGTVTGTAGNLTGLVTGTATTVVSALPRTPITDLAGPVSDTAAAVATGILNVAAPGGIAATPVGDMSGAVNGLSGQTRVTAPTGSAAGPGDQAPTAGSLSLTWPVLTPRAVFPAATIAPSWTSTDRTARLGGAVRSTPVSPGKPLPRPGDVPRDMALTQQPAGTGKYPSTVAGIVANCWLPALTAGRVDALAHVNGRGRFILHGRLPG